MESKTLEIEEKPAENGSGHFKINNQGAELNDFYSKDTDLIPMPNIASLFKSEISRVARKEIRAEVESLRKAVATYRSEIAALKRRTQALEQQLKQVHKSQPKAEPVSTPETGNTLRFSAKGLAKQRQRLGLSAEGVGTLVGASGQSIYNWEDGKARPRAVHLAALAALGGLSKKQAADILAARKAAA
jgi:DNA-binding transcriptional regulator YiaG